MLLLLGCIGTSLFTTTSANAQILHLRLKFLLLFSAGE